MLGLLGFLRFHRLSFVKKERIVDDIYLFYFRPLRPLRHQAGQHSIVFLPGLSGVRVFSLASSPTEPYVMIGTHARSGSRYKQRLMRLKKGERLWSIGPVLNFVYRPHVKRVVFLAQGIGITPFRSMLVEASDTGRHVHSTLIHVDAGDHPFRSLTSRLASSANYPTTRKEFEDLLDRYVGQTGAQYYISGSVGFLRSTVSQLRSRGVPLSRMTFDDFLGY